MVDKSSVEYYEHVRDNYAEDVSKDKGEHTLYIKRYTEELRKLPIRVTVLDNKELLRFAFYFEDMREGKHLPQGQTFGNFLLENIKRNSAQFAPYFRQSLGKPITEKQQTRKGEILADISEAKTEEEKQQLTQSLEKIWNQDPSNLVVINETNNNLTEDENYASEEHKAFDEFQEVDSDYLLNSVLTESVIEIQQFKKQELENQFRRITDFLLGLNVFDKESLSAQLAEGNIYKQTIVGLFQELRVVNAVTSFDAGVREKKVHFDISQRYVLSEIKQGFAQAKVRIDDLVNKGIENLELHMRIKNLEATNSRLNTELRISRQNVDDMTSTAVNNAKNPVNNGKLLYLYVSWDEVVAGKKIAFYLGSKTNTLNDSGFYLVPQLTKTTDRKAAIRFKDRDHAAKQLQRVAKYYHKINRDAKISLDGHIKKARFVEFLECKRESVFTEPTITKVD